MQQIQTIRHNQQADYELYLEHEQHRLQRERLSTDELTEASEKLTAPMSNSFEYRMGSDGELWFQGQSFGPILQKSVAEAELVASRYPQFTVELVRRQIELQEYDDQRRLALGNDDQPDTLVVLSPIPDAAVEGVNLGAYDLDRRVTMVRVYNRTPDGIKATSLSLDLSDGEGLGAVARYFGQELSDDESSEEILSRRFWAYSTDFSGKTAGQVVRQTYDDILQRKYGGEWYAGQRDSLVLNVKEFIEQQTDLVDEHMRVMLAIQSEPDAGMQKQLATRARYDFVAALDRRLRGKSDIESDGGSILSGAGGQAKVDGVEYKSSCPSGDMLSADEAVDQLGLGGELLKNESFISRQCPLCGRKNILTRRQGEVISGSCGCWREICNGRYHVNQPQTQNVVAAATNVNNERLFKKPPTRQQIIHRQYGRHAVLKSSIVIGGKKDLVVDGRTGEQIASI